MSSATQTERQQMNLMTTQQAADLIYSTRATLRYWVKKGMLKKYPSPDGYSRRYLIDFDEVEKLFSQDWKERARENLPDNLISRKEAAKLLWINERSIAYYVRRKHLKKYYVFGNDYNYLLDRDEVLAQPKLYPERMEARKPRLREAAIKQNQARNEHGKFIKKQQI